jgi:hypothetical protein
VTAGWSLPVPEGLGAACALLDPAGAGALTLACAVVAALLLAAVAAGFLRLRSRPAGPADEDGGLLATWRLYRHLGRAAPGRR